MTPFDLVNAPPRDRELFLDGYAAGWTSGYVSGVSAGRQAADDEAAEMWQTAAAVVHRMAELPERDHAADERRAERSRQWWARRRGENAAGMSTRAIAPVVGVSKSQVAEDISGVQDWTPVVDRETGEMRGEGTS